MRGIAVSTAARRKQYSIFRLARNGADAEYNWALACRSCNLRKFTHVEARDPKTKRKVRLFNPREDRWDKHFSVDEQNGTIEGVTSIGRVTVACLTMNSQSQVIARQQWMVLGLFP